MGVLGTNLGMSDTTKIVIAEVVDAKGYYEIAHVCGDNEDFVVLCIFPLYMPRKFNKESVNEYLKNYNSNFPVYTCKISHKNDVMSKGEAFNKILNATEPWIMEA